MKNAVVTEAYISGATKMEPADIEGAGESANRTLGEFLSEPSAGFPCIEYTGTRFRLLLDTYEYLDDEVLFSLKGPP